CLAGQPCLRWQEKARQARRADSALPLGQGERAASKKQKGAMARARKNWRERSAYRLQIRSPRFFPSKILIPAGVNRSWSQVWAVTRASWFGMSS
ncbi:unnamed protein product, partial [Urochloa humidicola]